MGTALVTGASAGLGRAFAVELAARGHDVVLVARNEGVLQQLAEELHRRHGVQAETVIADLADRDSLQRVADRVGDRQRPVDLVVNNAGFGIKAGFINGDIAEEERALDVMVRAVMVLSHAAAGPMRNRGHGAILNVSSVASFATVGTYSANKAWTTVFSEGLSADLAGSGVTVTALCPGFIRTEFHDRAQMNMGWLPEGMWLNAHRVALDALDDIAAGHVVSVPSLQYRLLVGLARSVPRPVVRRVSRRVSTVRR